MNLLKEGRNRKPQKSLTGKGRAADNGDQSTQTSNDGSVMTFLASKEKVMNHFLGGWSQVQSVIRCLGSMIYARVQSTLCRASLLRNSTQKLDSDKIVLPIQTLALVAN